MADLADIIGNRCWGLPTRSSRQIGPAIFEWDFAETAAFFHFRRNFLSDHKGGLVLNQATYKFLSTPTNPAINFVLSAMDIYLRNWFSPRNVSREGGARKPDGLGISADGNLIEIIEVKPTTKKSYYADGVEQLSDVIAKIKDGLVAYAEEVGANETPIIDPALVTVRGSPWKPKGDELTLPLVTANSADDISWICFKPTIRVADDGSSPIDGIILYEIHYIDRRQFEKGRSMVPNEVAQRFALAHAERVRQPALSLTPWARQYAQANASDMETLGKVVLALGTVGAVLLLAYLAVELAPALIVAGGETGTAGEVADLVFSEGTGSYRVAPMVRVAVEEYEAFESSREVVGLTMTAGS